MNRKKFKKRMKKIFDPKLLMAYFVVFIMVGSGFGFIMNYRDGGGTIEYFNDYRLRQAEQGYILYYEGNQLQFISHPLQVASFDMPDEVVNALKNSMYFTMSFNPDIEGQELQYSITLIFQHLNSALDKIVGLGITEENIMHDLNIVTCEDSSIASPVLVFNRGESNEVLFNETNGCVEINSREAFHRVEFADYLVYSILGVI